MLRILFLILLPFTCFGQYSAIIAAGTGNYAAHSLTIKQEAFDYLASQGDCFLSPIQTSSGNGGAFTDTGLTNPVSRDSAGNEGEPILSQWIPRNF